MKTEGNGSPQYQPAAMISVDPPVSFSGVLTDALQRHPLLILSTCILVLIGAYVFLEHATPLYTGTARIYVEQEIPKVVADAEEGVMSRLDSYLYTQAEILRSAPVLTDVLQMLDTERMQTFADVSNRASLLRRDLKTEVGKMDGIINVSFKAPDPREAADIVNTVVDGYVTFHSEQKRDAASALLKILEEVRAQCETEVHEKYQRMLEFTRQNEDLAFGSDQDNNVVVRHMERLLAQLSEARVATSQAKSFHETGLGMAENPAALRQLLEAWRGRGVDVAATNEMTALRKELKQLEHDKADVLLELKEDHPVIATLDAGIGRIRARMAELDRKFVQRQLAVLRQEHMDAELREEELVKQCEVQRQQVLLLHDQQAQYAILQSDYDEAKKTFDILKDRIKELNVTEEVGGLTVTVLERAQVAGVPSEPKRTQFMAISLFVGLFAGMGLALVRELLDQRLHSSQEISSLLRLPVLAVIPRMRSALRSGILRAQVVRACPTSPEAEAFRRLRTPLLFGLLTEKVKTILVTSPASGAGKTLVVSNLALAMAQAGQRVLMVDADWRAPRLHRIFKKDRYTKGLSTVLTGRTTLAEAIEPTGTTNLDILTCGPDASNLTEALTSERLKQMITTLASQYDRILIDAPPMLSTADAQILAAQCDGSVLVLRAQASTRKDSMLACSELTAVNARILGIVVNAVPDKYNRYYSNGYYGRRHSIQAIPRTDNGVAGEWEERHPWPVEFADAFAVVKRGRRSRTPDAQS